MRVYLTMQQWPASQANQTERTKLGRKPTFVPWPTLSRSWERSGSWELEVGCWVLGVRARLRRQTKKVFWVPFWQMSKTNIILRSWKIPLLSPTQLPHPIFSAKILANNCLRLSLGLDFGPLSLSCQYWWNTFGQKLDGNIKIPSHWHNALCNFTRAFAI